MIVEEGSEGWGFAGEVARLIGDSDFRSVTAEPHPIPAARDREAAMLPSVEKIVNAVLGMLP